MTIETCSVCKRDLTLPFTVDSDDPLADVIKSRHEERHTPHDRLNERDGTVMTPKNLTFEKVEWLS